MEDSQKTFIAIAVVIASILAMIGWTIYNAYPGDPKFDSAFYAATQPAEYSENPYEELLERFVDSRGLVHYAGLREHRELLNRYVRMIGALDRETYNQWSQKRQFAFWINTYNALILKTVIDNYPIEPTFLRTGAFPENSIRQIVGAWDRLEYLVMSRRMTLNEIVQRRLRAEFDEPRVHFALTPGALGAPPLRNAPYRGGMLDEQLDDQVTRFIAHPEKFRIEGSTVYLSKIFQWFGRDFLKKHLPPGSKYQGDAQTRACLNFLSSYLSSEKRTFLKSDDYQVKFIPYDWALNDRTDPLGEPSTTQASETSR